MRFWDSSAIVPLIAEEPASRSCRGLVRSDPEQVVWALTATEVLSALCRIRRERILDTRTFALSEARLERMAQRWTVVEDLTRVTERARILLRTHSLTAADALQLAAARVWVRDHPRRHAFVCADESLAEAAQREGFRVIAPG